MFWKQTRCPIDLQSLYNAYVYTHIHATIDHHPPCNQHQTCVCVWLDLVVQNAKERVSSKGWLYTAKCIDAFDHVLNSRDLFRTHSNHANQIPFPQKNVRSYPSACIYAHQVQYSLKYRCCTLSTYIYIYNYVYIYIYNLYIYIYIINPGSLHLSSNFQSQTPPTSLDLGSRAFKCIILDRLKWKSRGNHGFLSLQRFPAIFLYRFWVIKILNSC